MKIRKAEDHEKKNYRGVHPLFGFIDRVPGTFAKHKTHFAVAVEYLGEGKGEPNYEAIAPSGLHFDNGDRLHTVLGVTQRDLLDRISELVECTEKC